MTTQPTPGSQDARRNGCICPIIDNNHGGGCGRTHPDGTPMFWVVEDCPIHSADLRRAREEAAGRMAAEYEQNKEGA